MWFDTNRYLKITVRLFPQPGRKSFERWEIRKLGFSLSNQMYKPPEEFGPYYFIPSCYIFFAGEKLLLYSASLFSTNVSIL
jgi:hypothetical protein